MDELNYYLRPELSQSDLKNFMISPAYYKYRKENPIKASPAMILGTLCHALIFEPHKVHETFVIEENFNLRTKKGREDLERFKITHAGKETVKPQEYEQAKLVEKAVKEHAMYQDIFSHPSEVEKEVYFELDGVECRAKLDCIVRDFNAVLDLKTTSFPNYYTFQKEVIGSGYDVQAYWYCEAYKSLYGEYPDYYLIILAGTKPPYPVDFYDVDATFLNRGRFLVRKALKDFKNCITTGQWPANQSDAVLKLEAPYWAMKEVEEANENFFPVTKE